MPHMHDGNTQDRHGGSHAHTHRDAGIAHIHSHRNIIGFDENGVSVVTHEADHTPADSEDARVAFTKDYMEAVSAWRKTFPDKEKQIEKTPDPAVREMLKRSDEIGLETCFDRFDAQQPQCNFGLAGVCCKNCMMGPCRITKKAPRGVCGADADLIVARNLLRAAAAGASQHGMHAREVILSLKWAAEGKLDLPILGEQKIRDTARKFGIKTERRQLKNIASDLADVLLDDLSRTDPSGEYRTISAMAPEERQKVWKDLDVLPISAYHEVFEALHKSGCAIDGDWRSIMQQFLRCGLAFTFSGVVGASIATDSLFGVGDRVTSKVNLGALEPGYVNIAVHGHLPTLVSQIVAVGREQEFIDRAKAAGAKGIRFYGICCTGLASMYRYGGVIPLSNAVSAELVLGTGALDLWVADVQDVFPSIMEVARCFRTTVVTTSDSARLPGAERFEYDHRHSNIGKTRELACAIVNRGIESFAARRDVKPNIPPYETEAEVGFSPEWVCRHFGGFGPLSDAIRDGRVLGVVNLVGCSNPKVPYERCIVDVADELLANNVLILSNGCASFPLMKLGYCNARGLERCGEGLRSFLGDLPPVWHVGECIDNTRSTGIFTGVAGELGCRIADAPFAFSSPEWSNEKSVDAALAFRLMGVSSYHCVEPPIYGSKNVIEFLKEGTTETLGSRMVVDVDPRKLAGRIVEDMRQARAALGLDA